MKKILFKFFIGGIVISIIFGMQFSGFGNTESVSAKGMQQAATSTATVAKTAATTKTTVATVAPAAPASPSTTRTVTPTKPSSTACNLDDTSCLEGLYNGLTILIKEQEKRFEEIYKNAKEAEDLINKLNEEGKDTSALREALDNFTYLMGDAQLNHDQAKEIIDAHMGFDRKGKVTNGEQAKETVQDGKDTWLYASQALTKANKDLRVAIAKAKRKPPLPTKVPVSNESNTSE